MIIWFHQWFELTHQWILSMTLLSKKSIRKIQVTLQCLTVNRLNLPFFSLPKRPAPALAMASGPPATETTFLAASVRPNNTARAPQAPNLNQRTTRRNSGSKLKSAQQMYSLPRTLSFFCPQK